jgi:hypothetical protein
MAFFGWTTVSLIVIKNLAIHAQASSIYFIHLSIRPWADVGFAVHSTSVSPDPVLIT